MKNRVAIFDIDGTVFRSSLLIELVEECIGGGVFPARARQVYATQKERWLDREDEYEHYINAVVTSFEQYIQGVPYPDLAGIALRVAKRHQKRVYRYTRDLLRDLKAKRYFLLAVSQSPKVVLEDFCRQLGFDKIYGRMYETDHHEKFTGAVSDVHLIANKANIVRRAVEKENLTLRGSVGVGDTEGDIPFLEMVERPICFNPNEKLYRYARLMKWRIVVERKDVVYAI